LTLTSFDILFFTKSILDDKRSGMSFDTKDLYCQPGSLLLMSWSFCCSTISCALFFTSEFLYANMNKRENFMNMQIEHKQNLFYCTILSERLEWRVQKTANREKPEKILEIFCTRLSSSWRFFIAATHAKHLHQKEKCWTLCNRLSVGKTKEN
jgi:hypothetical protein